MNIVTYIYNYLKLDSAQATVYGVFNIDKKQQ